MSTMANMQESKQTTDWEEGSVLQLNKLRLKIDINSTPNDVDGCQYYTASCEDSLQSYLLCISDNIDFNTHFTNHMSKKSRKKIKQLNRPQPYTPFNEPIIEGVYYDSKDRKQPVIACKIKNIFYKSMRSYIVHRKLHQAKRNNAYVSSIRKCFASMFTYLYACYTTNKSFPVVHIENFAFGPDEKLILAPSLRPRRMITESIRDLVRVWFVLCIEVAASPKQELYSELKKMMTNKPLTQIIEDDLLMKDFVQKHMSADPQSLMYQIVFDIWDSYIAKSADRVNIGEICHFLQFRWAKYENINTGQLLGLN